MRFHSHAQSMTLASALLATLAFSGCRTSSSGDAELAESSNPSMRPGEHRRIVNATSDAASAVSSALAVTGSDGNRVVNSQLLSNTKCILAMRITKGALLLGGEGGEGLMACRLGSGWSAPSYVSAGGFQLSAAIGFEFMDLTFFITDDTVANNFKNQMNISMQPFVKALAGNASAALSTAQQYGLVAIYSNSSGLYAGVGISFTSIGHMQDRRNDIVYLNLMNGSGKAPTDTNGAPCSNYALPRRREACIAAFNERTGNTAARLSPEKILSLPADSAPEITKPFNDILRKI